jgi:outer membrane protein assembly factor BamB
MTNAWFKRWPMASLVVGVVALGAAAPPVFGAGGAMSMTGFSPLSGPVGTVVTISGTGFVGGDIVAFNGTQASGSTANAAGTRLKASVPAFAASGPILVTDPVTGQTVGLPGTAFRVATGLAASPASVWPGQAFTLSGSALSPDVAEVIMLNGVAIGQARTDAFGDFQARLTTPITLQPRRALVAIPDPNLGVISTILYILASWPQVSDNPARTANYAYETQLSTKSAAKIVPHWSGALVGYNYSAPIVAYGLVFVDAGNELEALDIKAGSLVWSFTSSKPLAAAPAVANGVLYLPTEEGNVYAFNALNGSPVWQEFVGAASEPSALVAGGAVFVGTNGGSEYKLSAADGHVIWTVSLGGFVDSPASIAGGVVYVSTSTPNVYALSAATGHILWFISHGGVVGAMAVSGGTLFVPSEDQHLYAVSTSTHAVLWSVGAGNIDRNGVALNGGTVFLSNSGGAGAFNASNGATIWQYSAPCGLYGAPAYANGMLYLSCGQSELGLDAVLGTVRWSWTGPTSDQFSSFYGPAVAAGVLYFDGLASTGTTGGLYTFGL